MPWGRRKEVLRTAAGGAVLGQRRFATYKYKQCSKLPRLVLRRMRTYRGKGLQV